MPFVLTSGPLAEPLSVTEAKAYLRVDHADEDTLIASLVTAARLHTEVALGRRLITQDWSLFFDAWPHSKIVEIDLGPIQAVTQISTFAEDATETIFGSENYFADLVSDPGRIVRNGGATWPAPGRQINGIKITFTAGYGDAAGDVPEPLRQALLLLVAHWYERREPVILGETAIQVPETVQSLLLPYRRVRL